MDRDVDGTPVFGAVSGLTCAPCAEVELFGFEPATADGTDVVAGEPSVEFATGLLLNRRAALPFDGVTTLSGFVAALVTTGFAGAAAACGGFWVAAVLEDCDGRGPGPPRLVVAELMADETAVIVRLATDCIADLIADIGLVATSDFAVVVQPAAGCCGLLQLEKLVVEFTWQQPQSCDFAP
jgi:hypothetical protein